VELEQVQRFHVHTAAGEVNSGFDDRAGHAAWAGNPFGEGLDALKGGAAITVCQFAAEATEEIFCRAIVVCQVPGGETGIVIIEHILQGGSRFNPAMCAGDLPQAI
jgi:hypothetical protein